MARGKKKESLTPEERLQAALVPESEQPYKVPENWRWTYWGICGDFQAGSAFKNEYQGLTQYDIPFYKVGSLKYSDSNGILYDTSNTINEEIRGKLKAALIPENSIIFAKIGEAIRLNRRSMNPVECCIDNNLMSFCAKICLAKYAYFWSLGIDLYNYANATTVPAIRKSDLEKVPFPLAPYKEQQRIVDRIESLFSKLDEAKQKAQEALDSFETRKAAILHKAFTGELTAQWRKEHGVGMESWKKKALGDITDILSSKRIYKEEYTASGIPFFRSSEVVDLYDTGNTEPTFFISEQRYEEIKNQYGVPDVGDLLVTSVGTIGKTWIVDNRKFYYKDGNLTQVRKSKLLDMRFLQFYIMSPEFKEQIEETVSGSAYNALTIVKFKKIRLPIPSVVEQSRIVRILDALLAKEQQAKEAAEGVLEQIDLIKKAILARAFRGELGTNDPTEESAVELLKTIM